MFDFQKEVVINSEKAFELVKDGVFRVDGMNYKVANVVDKTVYETAAVKGEKATITIDYNLVKDGNAQIRIELGLDSDYRGSFGSALYYFRKPILLDVREACTEDELKAALKLLAASNDNVLKVSKDDDLVLEAADDYITVRSAKVVKFDCVANCGGDNYEDVVEVNDLVSTPNKVGFGTYEYLIHNLRLPTYENLRFTSPAAVEAPVLGGEYTQFSFEYAVPRRIGGVSVVGQMNYSSTGHTFYVLSSIADKFKNVLAGLQVVPVEVNKFISNEAENVSVDNSETGE